MNKFNEKDCLKPYIAMKTELRQEAKNNLEKDFSSLTYNGSFWKTMENVRKHRDSKPKYGEKVKISYIDTGSFIVYVKKKTRYLQR